MDESGYKKKHGQTTYKIVGKLAVELATVIAGILIALFVNSIQEKKADKKNLDETLHALSLEFDKNTDNIKSKSHRLQRFRDTLEFYEKDASLSIYDLTVKSPGLTMVDLYTTNWQVTLSTNSLRSLLYNTAIYKNDLEGFYHRKVLAAWVGGYIGNEQELIELYDKFKARIAKGVVSNRARCG